MAQSPQIFPCPYADPDCYENLEILIRKHNEATKAIKSISLRISVSTVVLLILSVVISALVTRMINVPYEVLKRAIFYPISIGTGILLLTTVGTTVILLYRSKQFKNLEARKPAQTELKQING